MYMRNQLLILFCLTLELECCCNLEDSDSHRDEELQEQVLMAALTHKHIYVDSQNMILILLR